MDMTQPIFALLDGGLPAGLLPHALLWAPVLAVTAGLLAWLAALVALQPRGRPTRAPRAAPPPVVVHRVFVPEPLPRQRRRPQLRSGLEAARATG